MDHTVAGLFWVKYYTIVLYFVRISAKYWVEVWFLSYGTGLVVLSNHMVAVLKIVVMALYSIFMDPVEPIYIAVLFEIDNFKMSVQASVESFYADSKIAAIKN